MMNAAKASSTEAVKMLLENQADPDVINEEGYTAFAFAVKTDNIKVFKILGKVTSAATSTSLRLLAQSNFRIKGNLFKKIPKMKRYNQGMITSSDKLDNLFYESAFFGNPLMLDYLLNQN